MEFMIEFLKSFGLLAVLIVGLTLFKIFTCKPFDSEGEDFDWGKLLWGSLSKLGIAATVAGVYAAGVYFGGDAVMFTIGEVEYSLAGALQLMVSIAAVVYGKKFITNFAELLGIVDKVPEIKEVLPIDVIGDDE